VEAVSRKLRSFRLLHLEPQKLRQPSDRAAGTALLADGSNLPTVLAALGPEVRRAIKGDVESLVPGFRWFDVSPYEDELRLEVEFMDGKRLPARLLSDGTLRLLALFTLLRACRTGALVAIEEPENGVYPGRVRTLMEALITATSAGAEPAPQLLLSTHSTAIIEELRDRPGALVFTDILRGRDGLRSTRMRHVLPEGGAESGVPSVTATEMTRLLDAARPWDELMEE
jgi:predicted ATPase